MKSIYRVLCGAAAVCIGLGLLLGIIGTALGARPADLSLSATELPALRFLSRTPYLWGRDTVEVSYPADAVRKLDFDLEAVDVTIGAGEGRNWWCVVFPPLCAAASGDVPAAALAAGFTEEEVGLITEEDQGYALRFKAVEWWEALQEKFS